MPSTLRLLAVTVLPVIVLRALMMHVGFHRAEEPGFGGGDGLMFVPLSVRAGMSQYTFLRPAHLLAVANEQLLVAPLGLIIVVSATAAALWRGAWRSWPQDTGLRSRAHAFLVLVAGGFFALTAVWNPDLGALRDWDLFGPVGFYLSICGAALLCRHLGAFPQRVTALLVFVACVNLSRTLPFVLHNAGY